MAATLHLSPQRHVAPPQRHTTQERHSAQTKTRGPGAAPAGVYARRRLVVGLGLVLLGALAWTLAIWATNSSVGVSPVGADRSGDLAEVVVVQPGDTLWSIAADIDTDGDIRDTVDRLAALNGGSAVSAGQRLTIDG
jgi:hypothetical protein